MKSYHESAFTPRQLALYRIATRIFDAIPQGLVEDLRCHEAARIVGTLLDLPVEDGKYGASDHSWCVLDGVQPAILDPYAVGCMPPVRLVSFDGLLPYSRLYLVGPRRTDLDEKVIDAVFHRLQPSVNAWKRHEKDL